MRFTVITPTYNRADYLPAAFDSLCNQTFRDFEWLIVDDGSSDGTEALVRSWSSFFPIRYFWQENAGKHTAVNAAVREAHGEFVFILDSDDRCFPHTLERFDAVWREIEASDRYACLGALTVEDDGTTIIGKRLSGSYVDSFNLREALAILDAERCGTVRTAVLRKLPFPVFEGERFLTEGVVWNRLHTRYAARYLNEPLKIAGYAPGGLTDSGDLRWSCPRGATLFHFELALARLPLAVRVRAVLNMVRFALVAAVRRP